MTTGEKLAKLRKENNYTQEQLAELLNVSRQSISKWESDITYPEVAKLIQLAELYKCSLDYLVKNNQDEESQDETENTNRPIRKERKVLFTTVWSSIFFVLYLIFYGFPYIQLGINTNQYIPGMNNTITASVSVYRLLFTSNYHLGNFIILINFFILLFVTFVGIWAFFKDLNADLFRYRRIASIVEAVLWFIMLLIFGSNMLIGMLLVFLLSAGNCLGLFLVKKNRNLETI